MYASGSCRVIALAEQGDVNIASMMRVPVLSSTAGIATSLIAISAVVAGTVKWWRSAGFSLA